MIVIVLVLVFWALTVVDYVLTKRILANGGKELNPVMAWLIRQGAFAPVKFGIALVAGLLIVYYKIMWVAVFAVVLMVAVCVWNSYQSAKRTAG